MSAAKKAGVTDSPPLQRTVSALPPVHLDATVPDVSADAWRVTVAGMVREPRSLAIDDLATIEDRFFILDHHCVWGWSKPRCRWRGIGVGALLDALGVEEGATHVTVTAASSPYAACLPIDDAREGVLAWGLDGVRLPAENGGPLRFQQPPWLWGYKGVKWAHEIRVGTDDTPGFWEELVGDPAGHVPAPVQDQFEYWRSRR